MLLAPNLWTLAGAQVVNAMFISAVAGVGISYVQDLLPGHPGYVTTLFTNTFPIGQAIAGPLLGVSLHFGYRLGYGMGAILCAAGLALLLVTRPGHPRDETRTIVRVMNEPAVESTVP